MTEVLQLDRPGSLKKEELNRYKSLIDGFFDVETIEDLGSVDELRSLLDDNLNKPELQTYAQEACKNLVDQLVDSIKDNSSNFLKDLQLLEDGMREKGWQRFLNSPRTKEIKIEYSRSKIKPLLENGNYDALNTVSENIAFYNFMRREFNELCINLLKSKNYEEILRFIKTVNSDIWLSVFRDDFLNLLSEAVQSHFSDPGDACDHFQDLSEQIKKKILDNNISFLKMIAYTFNLKKTEIHDLVGNKNNLDANMLPYLGFPDLETGREESYSGQNILEKRHEERLQELEQMEREIENTRRRIFEGLSDREKEMVEGLELQDDIDAQIDKLKASEESHEDLISSLRDKKVLLLKLKQYNNLKEHLLEEGEENFEDISQSEVERARRIDSNIDEYLIDKLRKRLDQGVSSEEDLIRKKISDIKQNRKNRRKMNKGIDKFRTNPHQGKNGSYLASIDSFSYPAIYKPATEEPYMSREFGVPKGECYKREWLAYKISHALGFNLVPETIITDGPSGVGALQKWTFGHPLENVNKDDLYHVDPTEPEMISLGVFDVLINNADRKISNYLIQPSGSVVAIDHAFSMPTEERRHGVSVTSDFAGAKIPPETIKKMKNFLNDEELQQLLETAFDFVFDGGGNKMFDDFMGKINYMCHTGKVEAEKTRSAA